MLQDDASKSALCISCAADRCATCPLSAARSMPPVPPTAKPLPDHVFRARGIQIGLRTCLDPT